MDAPSDLEDRTWVMRATIIVAIGVALTALRVLGVVAFPSVIAGDSIRYRNPENPFNVFFPSRGAGPGVLPQLFFLAPHDVGLVLQTLASGAVWTFLAVTVSRGRFGLPLGILMLAWSLNPWNWMWDSWYLSESLAISGMVMLMVGLGRSIPRNSRVEGLVIATAGMTWTLLSRPFLAILAIPLVLVFLLFDFRWNLRNGIAAWLLPAILLGCVFAGWQVSSFERASINGQSLTAVRATDRLWGRWANEGYAEAAIARGMPTCPDVVRVLPPNPRPSKSDIHVARHSDCPGYQEWLAAGGLPWLSEVMANPWVTMVHLLNPRYWLNNPVKQYSPYDPRLNQIRGVLGGAWPKAVWAVNLAAFICIGLGMMSIVIGWRLDVVTVALAVFLLSFGCILGLLLTDGIEYWRHVVPILLAVLPFSLTVLSLRRADSARGRPSCRSPR